MENKDYEPNIVDPNLNRLTDEDSLILEPFVVPEKTQLQEASRLLGIDPRILCGPSRVIELVLRTMAATNTGTRGAVAGELLTALREFRQEQCG